MAGTLFVSSTSAAADRPKVIDELVSFNAPGSLEADQYRTLRHVVERLSQDSDLKVIAVTSPGPGDGKTVTTLNLAGSLAQTPGSKILVIDADLHRPAVASHLGLSLEGTPGLEDVVRADEMARVAQATRRIDALNISVLLSGGSHVAPYEVLGTPRVGALIEHARTQYDYVIIDTPPAIPLADCRMLARWVDGFIVVVGAHTTPRRQLVDALAAIERSKIVGLVFNGDDQPMRAAYYGYYKARQRAAKKQQAKVKTKPSSHPPSVVSN
jgi:capsular exopolysaccharide synthesis family protein